MLTAGLSFPPCLQYADDAKLQEEWTAAKVAQKQKLTAWLHETTGVDVNPEAMFDIQVKRIHEYKRQLLNILGVIYKYKKLKEMPAEERKKVRGKKEETKEPVLCWAAGLSSDAMRMEGLIGSCRADVPVLPPFLSLISQRLGKVAPDFTDEKGAACCFPLPGSVHEQRLTGPRLAMQTVPRVVMFGGKAFATYWQAKRIVKLVTDVGRVVNADPDIGDLLKVIMVPNYNVTVAEKLIPASELSQHIR